MQNQQDKQTLRSKLSVAFVGSGLWLTNLLSIGTETEMNSASNVVSQTDWMGLYTSTAVGGLVAGIDTGLICAAVYWCVWRVQRNLLAQL